MTLLEFMNTHPVLTWVGFIVLLLSFLGVLKLAKLTRRGDEKAIDAVVEALKRDSAGVLLDLERQMTVRFLNRHEEDLTPEEQELWDIGTDFLDSEQGRKDWPRPEAVELSHYLHSINYRNMDAPNLAADILQHLRKKKTTP